MIDTIDGEIIRKTLLDFNLAEHYVDAIMTEIERRIQLQDVMDGLREAFPHGMSMEKAIEIFGLDEDVPTNPVAPSQIGPSPLAGQRTQGIEPIWNWSVYQRLPRVQPYNHDRSTL